MANEDPDNVNRTMTPWPIRLGGLLLFAGTGLSMLLEGWMAEVAMGAALVGLVLVLIRRRQ